MLDLPEVTDTDPLRRAFAAMPIARKMSFEQAMRDPALAICIRNAAEAARRKQEGV